MGFPAAAIVVPAAAMGFTAAAMGFTAAAMEWPHRQRRRAYRTRPHGTLAGPVTLARRGLATALLTAFRERSE
jgi:hypothetical protein